MLYYKSGPLHAIDQLSHDGIAVSWLKDSCQVCHQSLVGFDLSLVNQIGRFEVRPLLVKLSRALRSSG